MDTSNSGTKQDRPRTPQHCTPRQLHNQRVWWQDPSGLVPGEDFDASRFSTVVLTDGPYLFAEMNGCNPVLPIIDTYGSDFDLSDTVFALADGTEVYVSELHWEDPFVIRSVEAALIGPEENESATIAANGNFLINIRELADTPSERLEMLEGYRSDIKEMFGKLWDAPPEKVAVLFPHEVHNLEY